MSRSRTKIGRLVRMLGLAAVILFVCFLALSMRVKTRWGDRRYNDAGAVPVESKPRTAIVFGAGVWSNGDPSPVLYDRIATAVELYRDGRVNKLLLSGDNRFANYNEPAVMRETARRMGVPDGDLIEDFAGRRTYDTCYRAHQIFGIDRAIVVTQAFHLDRALYLCNGLGIDSIGVIADRQNYARGDRLSWNLREVVARAWAWGNINIYASEPILGEKEPIRE